MVSAGETASGNLNLSHALLHPAELAEAHTTLPLLRGKRVRRHRLLVCYAMLRDKVCYLLRYAPDVLVVIYTLIHHAHNHAPAPPPPLQVLLVEPSAMVRHVLSEALTSWGCAVAAVDGEAAALRLLCLGADDSRDGACSCAADLCTQAPAPLLVPAPTPAPPARSLVVEHCTHLVSQAPGPYDVVILDMTHVALVTALTRASSGEAQRLVFLGWPGQNEGGDSPPPLDPVRRRGRNVAAAVLPCIAMPHLAG